MSPVLVGSLVGLYFLMLLSVSYFTGRRGTNSNFFTANRNSPWYVVAFGMIGASISGVSFLSVPGWVKASGFSYFQMVLGYMVGYYVIATVLLPMYYRLGLSSIYGYLATRFGLWSYRTGSAFFILSKSIGAAFRLYVVAVVLQLAMFDTWGIPFWATVLSTLLLIWLYTFRAGIKTIVWTDTLQTFFMLAALGSTVYLIAHKLGFGVADLFYTLQTHPYAKVFHGQWDSPLFFGKQFLSGAFIAIVMTGLDQDMMQKNLTCRSNYEAQKNMFWLSVALLPVNWLFLSLGVLLYIFAANQGIALPARADDLYPMLALEHLGLGVGILFVLGIIAAAFSSADSALTALTTAFCIDFLRISPDDNTPKALWRRRWTHIGFALWLAVVVVVFRALNDSSVIGAVFTAAGYTYGPLLGLFAFGLFTERSVRDKAVPWLALASPILAWGLDRATPWLFNGYKMGYELLIFNGLFTFIGLWILSRRAPGPTQ